MLIQPWKVQLQFDFNIRFVNEFRYKLDKLAIFVDGVWKKGKQLLPYLFQIVIFVFYSKICLNGHFKKEQNWFSRPVSA